MQKRWADADTGGVRGKVNDLTGKINSSESTKVIVV